MVPQVLNFDPYPFRNRCSNRWTFCYFKHFNAIWTHTWRCLQHQWTSHWAYSQLITLINNIQKIHENSQSLRQVGNLNSEWIRRLSACWAPPGAFGDVWRLQSYHPLRPSPMTTLCGLTAESEGRPSAQHRQRQRKGALRSALAAWNDAWSRQTATPQSYTGISTSHS